MTRRKIEVSDRVTHTSFVDSGVVTAVHPGGSLTVEFAADDVIEFEDSENFALADSQNAPFQGNSKSPAPWL